MTVHPAGDDVAVGMGVASVERHATVQGFEGVVVDVGNPHFVTFVEDPWAIDLEVIGPVMEHDAVFPNRANIHFAALSGTDTLIQRTWERGAGITLACGSGATAGAAAALHLGLTGRYVRVQLPGGDLKINFDDAGHATMIGKAEFAFTGSWAA